MKRLILTTDASGAGSIGAARLADLVITLERRLVWGPPLSQAQLDAFFAVRGSQDRGLHWQDYTPEWRLERSGGKDLGFIEFCSRYDQIELWIDPDPNAQLNLVWLLDFLGAHEEPASKMKFVQADFAMPEREPEELARWQPIRVGVTGGHLDLASVAWRAYRSPTPQDWFNLLALDLSLLPRLRWAVVELLNELPRRTTGLGATEMWMLARISEGRPIVEHVFRDLVQRTDRGAFGSWEAGELLNGLAHCPAPAIVGLHEGPFTMELYEPGTSPQIHPEQAVIDAPRQSHTRRKGRLQPAQSDPSLVGRYGIDERSAVALESREPRFDFTLRETAACGLRNGSRMWLPTRWRPFWFCA